MIVKILKDVFSQIKVITVDKIQNIVSNYFNISLSEMLSQRRSRPLAEPRQIAMYLAKKMTIDHSQKLAEDLLTEIIPQ